MGRVQFLLSAYQAPRSPWRLQAARGADKMRGHRGKVGQTQWAQGTNKHLQSARGNLQSACSRKKKKQIIRLL